MAVDIPDPADGDEPLRALLIGTLETPETLDSSCKAEFKALAMAKRENRQMSKTSRITWATSILSSRVSFIGDKLRISMIQTSITL